jgi:hypothetical protein
VPCGVTAITEVSYKVAGAAVSWTSPPAKSCSGQGGIWRGRLNWNANYTPGVQRPGGIPLAANARQFSPIDYAIQVQFPVPAGAGRTSYSAGTYGSFDSIGSTFSDTTLAGQPNPCSQGSPTGGPLVLAGPINPALEIDHVEKAAGKPVWPLRLQFAAGGPAFYPETGSDVPPLGDCPPTAGPCDQFVFTAAAVRLTTSDAPGLQTVTFANVAPEQDSVTGPDGVVFRQQYAATITVKGYGIAAAR